MISLEHLPPPPTSGQVTAYESDGRLCALSQADALDTAHRLLGDLLIRVVVGQEPVHTAHSKQEARQAFYAHTETPWQKIMFAYHEEGWMAAVQKVVQCQEEGPVYQVGAVLGSLLLGLWSGLARAHALLPSPTRTLSAAPSPAHGLEGCSGSVVSVAWHPHTATLAAVFCDDTVRVFMAGRSVTPLLKHRLQKGVTQIAWMPYSASVLAVGCEGGVLLWTLDPVSILARPSGSCATLLTHPSVTPVTSLSWHPKGQLLAVVGGSSREVMVCEVGREMWVGVHGGGLAPTPTLVQWSPDGARLLVAYSTKVMRVFETRGWSYEEWGLECGVQSAVWSTLGHTLLFATQQEPVLYHLAFLPGQEVGGTQVAAQVADLTSILVTTQEGEEISVGGRVKQLAWDPRSERLAVLFHDTECVVLFHTHTHPTLHLAPGGFVRGEAGHVPVSMAFQQNLPSGSVLSVVWSSGQVNHIPMLYSSREVLGRSFTSPAPNTSVQGGHSSLVCGTSFTSSTYPQATTFTSPTSPLTGRIFSSP